MAYRFPARWLGHDPSPNPLSEAVAARRATGGELLDLTVSNPTAVGLTFPHDWPQLLLGQDDNRGGGADDAGCAAAEDGAVTETIRGYDPDPRGLVTARRAVASYYTERDVGKTSATSDVTTRVNADDIFLTAGTSEAYAHLFKLLCEPGDTILVPRPSYPLLETLADLAGLSLESYPLVADQSTAHDVKPRGHEAAVSSAVGAVNPTAWRLDRAALKAALGPRARVVVVVSPNNPTGSVLTADDAAWLLDLARARGLALIVDEVFADYRHDGHDGHIGGATHDDGAPSLLMPDADGPLVFTLNGLSKLVGLPQLKLAWIHMAGSAADKAVAAEALEWMGDAALSVGTAPQLAAPELLRRREEFQGPIKARVAANLAALRDLVTQGAPGGEASHLQVLWPEGGWCVPVRCTGIKDDERFAIRLVEEAGVLVQPGYFFDFDDDETVVVSLLTPPEVFREGMTRLARFAR